jgi:aspartyl-tRNA(Asn)/glutamyl-tRNA(Gln) amidotransferase subunit A
MRFSEIRKLLDQKQISSVELTRQSLDQAQKTQDTFNPYYLICKDRALIEAQHADERLAAGETAPLLGVPYALKDLILAEGLGCTAGSKILENFVAPYNAHVVEALQSAGSVLVAKTSLDEFGMGSSNENSFKGPVKNPAASNCTPGGSSGGSAASVAAGDVSFALGTDTGGSIRQPAAFCGVTGLKPSYGRVSRYGLMAFASSLDQIGPIGDSAEACAAVLQSLAGHDIRDATSSTRVVEPYWARLCQERSSFSLKGLRVGVPRQLDSLKLEPEVRSEFEAFLEYLVSEGAEKISVDLPHFEYALPTYYLICTSEASSNLSRYNGVHVGQRAEDADSLSLEQIYSKSRGQNFGLEVRSRILLGTYALSSGYYDAYYKKAAQMRRLIYEDFKSVYAKVDFVLMPTAPEMAFGLGERSQDPLKMYASDLCTLPASLAGVPAISFPSSFKKPPRPVGLQLMAPWFAEQKLLQVVDHFERQVYQKGVI